MKTKEQIQERITLLKDCLKEYDYNSFGATIDDEIESGQIRAEIELLEWVLGN